MVAITGGGTGGHLVIAKVLKEELIKTNEKVVFIGSNNGQDKKWFEKDEDFTDKYFFNTSGVVNKSKIGKIISLIYILTYTIKCFFIFKKYNIKKVISVGGYSSASASFAAVILKRDFYIHEQNAHVGSLNKLLQPYAKYFFSSYQFNFKNLVKTSYPINNSFFKHQETKSELKTIIFLGGSQGASFINNFAIQVAIFLKEKNINIIHQSGDKDFQKLKNFYNENHIEVDLFAFSNNLQKKISKSDFAVSRSGASTLWELVASGIPTLFIPYPYAASNHQYFNVKFLEAKSLCFIQKENELTTDKFQEIIKNTDVKSISQNLKKEISKDGAKHIISAIMS